MILHYRFMFQSFIRNLTLVFLLSLCGTVAATTPKKTYQVSIAVCDKANREPIVMAKCALNATDAMVVTDVNGRATMTNVPEGNYTLSVSYVGYETYETQVKVGSDLNMDVRLTETSLSLKEVNVVARQKTSGASTTSVIGRQAIDHLQATSLADIMQLLPGQLMGNVDLTGRKNLQLRSLVNNNTSAFGSSIVIDGMPMSNNGALSEGTFNPAAFVGTDLRQVGADNIDHVEVIRGIPSAEYGDLTSGLVVVHSKAGVTPYQVKAKITPELQNYSLGKGFSLGRAGIINVSGDYAKAWGDPRAKTRSYDRYNFNVGYAYDISRRWHTDTKFRFMQARDWSGNDPDAIDDGTSTSNRNTTFGLTHNGRIAVDKPLMRSLNYTLGLSLTDGDSRTSSYVSNTTGLLPIITAMESGYYAVPWMTTSYLATGITKTRPGNVFAKVNDSFFFRTGNFRQTFKVGMEYSYNWNSGRGYYNADEMRPFRSNSNGRPRAFSDIPGLHQLAAFAEDNLLWSFNRTNHLRVNFGLRFTSLQPFSAVATTALSPRLNVSYSVTRWLDVRGGIGLNSKTPGLNYLYPDKKYDDRVAANYMPQNDPAGQLLVYHTQVYDVRKSKNLKNATTTKVEAGFDVKLPWGGSLGFLAYHDKTPNGFGPSTEYTTYNYGLYTAAQGLNITPGQATTVDYANPAVPFTVMMTTGKIGNTNTSVNKGVELDFNFGEIKPVHTTFYLSGAYQETKIWSTDLNTASVRSALLPVFYTAYGMTPFKVVYPSGRDYDAYRRFLTTLRLVTNIPELKMVATFTAQAIWYDWSHSFKANKSAVGWIDFDLQRHDITPDMANGYLGMDARYYSDKPADRPSVLISDLANTYTDSRPTKNPLTWNMSARLTKQLGRFGGLSVYVNNCLFYEPYLKGNNTTTLSQRNTNNFSFGAELYFNL